MPETDIILNKFKNRDFQRFVQFTYEFSRRGNTSSKNQLWEIEQVLGNTENDTLNLMNRPKMF